MINQVYRLVAPRQFEIAYQDRGLESGQVVVRPTHLSICAADQRYYTGSRGQEVLSKKLPMALIHEGIGEVAWDGTGQYAPGTRVVMVPNTPTETDEVIAENYLRSSRFRSSGYDGFLQDYVFMDADRLVPLHESIPPHVAAFTELVTIAVHALSRFSWKAHRRREAYGVWGDGNLGFITSLILKRREPNCKVYLFGKNPHKVSHFSFVDEVYRIDAIPDDVRIDHAIECVGGKGSQSAINQIIDTIQPEGAISMLGVSEYPVEINTRMVLEKGLTMIGSSRSGRRDFVETVEMLQTYPEIAQYLETLVGEVYRVRTIQDIVSAFEGDLSSPWGKTVIEWVI
jgi:ribitol-5-phosphate 2-dehydrogenase (NADP+)